MKTLAFHLAVWALVLIANQTAFCQVKKLTYTFSLDTAKAQTLPFDIPFTVKVPYDKADPITEQYLLKLNRKGGFIPDRVTSFASKSSGFTPLALTYLEEDAGKQYLDIDLPALKPDKRYIILVVTKKDQKSVQLEYFKKYCKNPAAYVEDEILRPEPYYFDRGKRIEVKVNDIKSTLNSINADCAICDKIKNKPVEAAVTPYSGRYINTNLPYFHAIACDTCYKKSASEISFILTTINTLELWRESVLDGTYKLDTLALKHRGASVSLLPSKAPALRIENIKATMLSIAGLKQSMLLLRALYPTGLFDTEYDTNIFTLNMYIDKCRQNIAILENNIKLTSQYENEINTCISGLNLQVGWQYNALRGGTASYRFYTRNSLFIKPDFGVIYYGDKLIGSSTFSGGAPFVGFHVNFRATNENVPFWTNLKIWQFPTLQFGVPIFAQALSQDDSRKYLVADKFSLFTGIGINLAHTVRLHYGAVWFQSLQSVQGSSKNYKVASIPYIGFSIDLRLKKLFPGLSDAIFGVKDVPGY